MTNLRFTGKMAVAALAVSLVGATPAYAAERATEAGTAASTSAFGITTPAAAVAAQESDRTTTAPAIGEIFTKTMKPFPSGNQLAHARGSGMERTPLEIALAAGAEIEVRVKNGVRNVAVRVVTNTTEDDTEVTLNPNGDWSTLTAKRDAAVYAKLRDDKTWLNTPTIEYRVKSGTAFRSPIFRLGDDPAAFFKQWDETKAPFAALDDDMVLLHVPIEDRAYLGTLNQSTEFKSLTDIIEQYRLLINTFDTWYGLDASSSEPHRQPRAHKFFIRPDTKGSGSAAYGPGSQLTVTSSSMRHYLETPNSWLTLHEIGHGYDGMMIHQFDGADISLDEVWNNVYAHTYQVLVTKRGSRFYPNGDYNTMRDRASTQYHAGTLKVNGLGLFERNDFLLRILEASGGVDSFTNFNQLLLKQRQNGDFSQMQRRSDLIARFWGHVNGMNLLPYFEANAAPLTKPTRKFLLEEQPASMAMPIDFLVKDRTKAEAIKAELGAVSRGSLATTSKLRGLSHRSSATITAEGPELAALNGREVTLWDGTTQVASAPFADGKAIFGDLPYGAYTVRYPHNPTTGDLPQADYILSGDSATTKTVKYKAAAEATAADETALRFLGAGGWEFMRLTHDRSNNTINMRESYYYAHYGFGANRYAQYTITAPDGTVIKEKTYLGHSLSTHNQTFNVPVGSRVKIFHAEVDRFRPVDVLTNVSRDDLKSTVKDFTLVVTKHGLVKDTADAERKAAEILASQMDAYITKFKATVAANPNGYFAPDAVKWLQTMTQLPDDLRAPAEEKYKAYLLTFLPKEPEVTPEPTVEPTTPEPTPEPTTPAPTVEPTPEPTTPAPTTPAPTPTTPAPTPTPTPTTPAPQPPAPKPATPVFSVPTGDHLYVVDAKTGAARVLTFAEWVALGAPKPQAAPVEFVKYPWSPAVTLVAKWSKNSATWSHLPVSFPEFQRAGFPRVATSHAVVPGTNVFKFASSDELFVSHAGVTHKLSFAEWSAMGFPAHTARPEGFLRLPWSKEVRYSTSATDRAPRLVSLQEWIAADRPTPKTARVIGDGAYLKSTRSNQLFYVSRAVGIKHPLTFAQWLQAGAPQPTGTIAP